MSEPRPLSTEELALIRKLIDPKHGRRAINDVVDSLLASDQYWREAIQKMDVPRCPFHCDPSVHEAALGIRELWGVEPVANTMEWHAAVLRLVQALDLAEQTESE